MRSTTRRGDLEEFSRDAGVFEMTPRVAYFAESEKDVAVAMSEAMARGDPVTARGGGTSISSQSVGRGAILVQTRHGVRVEGGAAFCEPGVVKADLNGRLAAVGRWMPVDPSSYASCTIGGMVANNSSGARTMKYGSTVDYVSSLRAVFPGEGPQTVVPIRIEDAQGMGQRVGKAASLIVENQKSIAEDRPRVTKNSSGYRLDRALHDGVFDIPKLLVGSEGTLCIFTEAELATIPPPRWRLLLIVESGLEELDRVAAEFRKHGPSAIELVDKSVFREMGRWDRIAKYSRSDAPYLVFCEYDGARGDASSMAELLANSGARGFDPMVLQSSAEISAAWEVRSETLAIAQDIRKEGKTLVPGVEDLVAPTGRLAELVELLMDEFGKRGLDYISYGHAGDANIHARPFLDMSEESGIRTLEGLMEDCFERVWRMGGSITGEHGDGMLRARYVERQYPKTYWIMEEIKSLFDPEGVLNPGVKISRP
ncbi:MAG TPA: FAD-binding oxidoreductase [Nitrososphaerales archaeon]|nr:FAD-binding oxidoreductase [Nitrososphaerales archaeon]